MRIVEATSVFESLLQALPQNAHAVGELRGGISAIWLCLHQQTRQRNWGIYRMAALSRINRRKAEREGEMENAWTQEIDRLRAENKQLLGACKNIIADLDECRAKWGMYNSVTVSSYDAARAAIAAAEGRD